MADKVAPINPEEATLDFSGVRPFEPLNEGVVYLCQVTGMKKGQGPKGAKYSVELTVRQPEEIDIERDGKQETIKIDGRKLFREYSLVPEALPFLHEFLRACGEENLGAGFVLQPTSYLGSEVGVRVKNEEFEEQVRSRPAKILPASAYVS